MRRRFFYQNISNGDDPFNGHDYVDLGLPSGTLWATSVIKNKLGEPLYFAWGDTEGWTAEQINNGEKEFTSSDYKWNEGEWTPGGSSMTKYNATDGKTVLDLEDDAAHVHMGGDWHMPTKEQWEELTANTTSKWITKNGVNGRLFTSKTNGESVFVPVFGYANDGSLYGVGSSGYVWGSSVDEDYLNNAWNLYFSSSSVRMYVSSRAYGRCVLGVVG